MLIMRQWCLKYNRIVPFFIVIFVTIPTFSGQLSPFFINIIGIDDSVIYLVTIGNLVFASFFTLLITKLLYPQWSFGFGVSGLKIGIRRYGLVTFIAFICLLVISYFAYQPLNQVPGLKKIVFHYFLFLTCVGLIEELLIRGLLLNTIKNIFIKSKYCDLLDVILSAAIFGLAHVPNIIGQTLLYTACQVAWSFGAGVFLGAVYVKTKNLWVPIIFHNILNYGSLPSYFSTQTMSEFASILIVVPFILIGLYGIILLKETKFAK